MTKVVCDKCGKEISKVNKVSVDLALFELCDECFDAHKKYEIELEKLDAEANEKYIELLDKYGYIECKRWNKNGI